MSSRNQVPRTVEASLDARLAPFGLNDSRQGLEDLKACLRQAKKAGRSAAAIAEDCAGAGFEESQGDYAAWLFLDEWNRSGKSHKRR